MFFTGDIAQPGVGNSSFVVPDKVQSNVWLGNLEGSLIDDQGKKEDLKGVYNNFDAIATLLNQTPFKAFNVANNHLLDAADVRTTLDNAKKLGVSVVGAGLNLHDAQKPITIIDNDGISYRILAFGWENIQCVPAKKDKQGVNPYTRENVIQCVSKVLRENEPVICFMHWDYELEKYPQPYDRQLAMELIDMGVAAVIGCHAHRTQPVEFYKGKPIVYGLGNFFFCQHHYFGGNLCFPKVCEEEYAFEITKEDYRLHYFHYDLQKNVLEYVKSAEISADRDFDGKAEFSGMSTKEYEKWFKAHRVQRKLLPVFQAHETALSYWTKSKWIQLRGWLLDTAQALNLKSAKRG